MNTTLTTDRLPDVLPQNPLDLACEWFAYAQDHAAQPNPNAMSLVSIGEDGQPSVRIVLCKSFVANPGYLVFFTNYESHKGRDLIANPRAAVVMHWDALGRQIRVEGQALRSPAAESDEYFASRARGSQLGAWGSDQSRPLESRRQLLAQLRERAAGLAGETPAAIPRPPHWGGFRIWIQAIELWIEGGDRIHDRARWERTLTKNPPLAFKAGNWSGGRLQP